MVGRVFIAILALILMFGFSSVITGGVHDLRTDEITQSEEVTTAGEVEKDVELNRELFKGAVDQVKSISSDLAPPGEKPSAKSYTSPNLTIKDLTPGETRTLTIIYYSEIDDPYMAIIGPFLGFIIFGGIIFALIWGVWKRH